MIRALSLAAIAWFTPALAQDDDVETVFNGRRPVLSLPDGWENPADTTNLSEFQNLPFEPQAYRGAEQLGLNPEFVHDVRAGLELMYLRDYPGCRRHFEGFEQKWPGTGIAPVMDVVVWQALMLENFDFEYDRQYQTSSRRAREALTAALRTPGNEGWEHFLSAGVVGIEAIHTMRKEQYLTALSLTFEAMDHVAQAKRAVPAFVDLKLADGMYHYWRSVVTMSSSALPDFGDHRELGITEMTEVQAHGVFLGPPATMSLAFAYLEEHKLKSALSAAVRNARVYPDNVINNLMLGQIQTYLHRYDEAQVTYDRVLAAAPNNKRVRYWKGLAYLRAQNPTAAIPELQAYLGAPYLETYHKAAAEYRLGQAFYRLERYPEAYAQYQLAVQTNGYKPAKAAIDRMKAARSEGRIRF
jgi:tetratricopeptide (TPR) repeat protein